jgi:hypothetical protein
MVERPGYTYFDTGLTDVRYVFGACSPARSRVFTGGGRRIATCWHTLIHPDDHDEAAAMMSVAGARGSFEASTG